MVDCGILDGKYGSTTNYTSNISRCYDYMKLHIQVMMKINNQN